MERTRIVHYTHSRIPVILSPKSPTAPRLPSSSSLSSLISVTEDKAPLASIDTENPASPRRSSKSGDQASVRSSSTGRLIDDSKLGTSIYTALRCQDYPVPASNPTTRRERNENSTKPRPRSSYTKSYPTEGESPIIGVDNENYRHTLGSWSRSRRKSNIESPNSKLLGNSSTLPLRGVTKIESPSSDTLVKARRRYTWLGSRQTVPQGPTINLPLQKHNLNGSDHSPVSPISPNVLTPSPKTDSTPECEVYDWKNDPRRKPFNFHEAFDLSPSGTPPEPCRNRDPLSLDYTKDFANYDTGYNSASTTENNPWTTMSLPKTDPSSRTCCRSNNIPHFDLEKCNMILHQYNSPSNNESGTNETKAPMKDLSEAQASERLYQHDSDQEIVPSYTPASVKRCNSMNTHDFYHSSSYLLSNEINGKCSQDQQRLDVRDHAVRDSSKIGVDTDVSNCNTKLREAFSVHKNDMAKNFSINSKRSSMFSGDTPKLSAEIIRRHSSPRNRHSFRMAVGDNDDLSDLLPPLDDLPPVLDEVTPSDDSQKIGNSPLVNKNSVNEDDIFISCDDLLSPGRVNYQSESIQKLLNNGICEPSSKHAVSINGGCHVGPLNESDSNLDDSLIRRIKRNSMRLATASLSDLTCAIDEIDIGDAAEDSAITDTKSFRVEEAKSMQNISSSSPMPRRTNLSRTGSLLSSGHNTSFGSFYSCQSIGSLPCKNSPSSNASYRQELRSKFDSPVNSRLFNNQNNHSAIDQSSTLPRACSNRASSPVSTTSSGRSSHRKKQAYYWTRQPPYPKLVHTASSSVASSKGDYPISSPSLSTTSSIRTNSSNHSNHTRPNTNIKPTHTDHVYSEKSKTVPKFCNYNTQDHRTRLQRDLQPRQQVPPNSSNGLIDRRSLTLPIAFPHSLPPHYHTDRQHEHYSTFTPELSPTSVIESPDDNTVRSPPSLGRPKRKVYAGFDSQPLPMDSFMSDSSSVYTGVSCSSRATDMTGQPDNSQFDESFISDDFRSNYEDSREDISFEGLETMTSPPNINEVSNEMDENESKHGSVHSTSTAKHENVDSSLEEKDRFDCSFHNTTDDFIENSEDCITNKLEKQFGSEYDAIFRLYKSDDLIGQSDRFISPSYPMFLQNGKALSSSCLFQSKLYTKRRFLSTRDIFDLIRNSDKTPLDGTVSLTSLERQAHKVCEAILCCDEIDQGYINKETHSLV